MDRNFQIGERQFKLNKINALKQFHIVRRIAPILGDIAPTLASMQKMNIEELEENDRFEQLSKLITPIMNGLSRLSDADANLVLTGLLGAVEMKQDGGNWAFLARDNNLMFDNLDLSILLNAAGRSLMFNLSGFFGALPQVS